VRLDGENIVSVDPVIGHLHRGIEKLMESRTYPQVIPYCDRLDYLSPWFSEHAYVQAVERLAGIEVPERAEFIRVIGCELNRIASHCIAIGTYGLDVGALTPFLYAFRERETIYDLWEKLSGGRMFPAFMRFGGVAKDVPPGWDEHLKAFLRAMPSHIDEYEDMLTTNEIFLVRTKGIGQISAEAAINHGMTGPNVRSSGVAYDVRKSDPYSVYDRFDFEVPVGQRGDCYDRYTVRIQEMRESVKILQQAIDGLPEGEHIGKAPKILKPPPGESYAHVEGPRGDIGVYIVSDGSTNPYRFRLRPPTFNHLSVLRELVKGMKVADFIAIFGSIDIILGEVDR
jgi:NADH:ubiquinone oxidoreductase subunit D